MVNAGRGIATQALFIYLTTQLVIINSLEFEVDHLMPTYHGTLIYSCQEVHEMTSWVTSIKGP